MAVALPSQPRADTTVTIPVIDLGPYCAGVPGALAATATALRSALESIGFFIIIFHGIYFHEVVLSEALRGVQPTR